MMAHLASDEMFSLQELNASLSRDGCGRNKFNISGIPFLSPCALLLRSGGFHLRREK